MTDDTPVRATRIAPFPNGELGIVWEDGHESYYPGHYLRCHCACAHCVDEGSGRKILRDETVRKDVEILELHPVGNYAISIRWSDGHDTGIYGYRQLRELCPCC